MEPHPPAHYIECRLTGLFTPPGETSIQGKTADGQAEDPRVSAYRRLFCTIEGVTDVTVPWELWRDEEWQSCEVEGQDSDGDAGTLGGLRREHRRKLLVSVRVDEGGTHKSAFRPAVTVRESSVPSLSLKASTSALEGLPDKKSVFDQPALLVSVKECCLAEMRYSDVLKHWGFTRIKISHRASCLMMRTNAFSTASANPGYTAADGAHASQKETKNSMHQRDTPVMVRCSLRSSTPIPVPLGSTEDILNRGRELLIEVLSRCEAVQDALSSAKAVELYAAMLAATTAPSLLFHKV